MTKKIKSQTIKLPSMLSFERKLEPSDGLMFGGNWDDIAQANQWRTIKVSQRKNRSTQSAYGIADNKKSEPNPVSADNDDANLAHDTDTLKLSFTLRIIGDVGRPFACNAPEFESLIHTKVNAFKAANGLKTLAYRYAYNIASGRFLWRNRVDAEKVEIHVSVTGVDEVLIFNAYDYSLKDFAVNGENKELKVLADKVLSGLSNQNEFVCVTVDAFVKLGKGQHVFPSQEMNMGGKKKVLFALGGGAAMHNVKIGNALRTIDDWYDDAESPIAIEPFGSVTQLGQAYRKSKNDLYSLMEDWVSGKTLEVDAQTYVVANLIRGGVFSGKKDK